MTEAFGQPHTAAQREQFKAPPCLLCGGRNIGVHWEEATDNESPERQWAPTQFTCRDCHGNG